MLSWFKCACWGWHDPCDVKSEKSCHESPLWFDRFWKLLGVFLDQRLKYNDSVESTTQTPSSKDCAQATCHLYYSKSSTLHPITLLFKDSNRKFAVGDLLTRSFSRGAKIDPWGSPSLSVLCLQLSWQVQIPFVTQMSVFSEMPFAL